MTRTEAIEVLRANYPDACYSLLREAVDMAINSLKIDEMYDLESENADEFISKSVIKDIKAEIGARVFDIKPKSNGNYFDGVDDVMDIVSAILDNHMNGKEQK